MANEEKNFILKKMGRLEKMSDNFVGFLQAIMAFLYIIFVIIFTSTCSGFFEDKTNSVTGPVLVLTLLVMSVIFMSMIVFAYPVYLINERKAKKAINVVGHSFFWLFVIFIFYVLILCFIK